MIEIRENYNLQPNVCFNFYYAGDFNIMNINRNIFKIKFIAEAAAIYCMYSSLKEHRLTEPGSTLKVY